jgi:hypothetical protein
MLETPDPVTGEPGFSIGPPVHSVAVWVPGGLAEEPEEPEETTTLAAFLVLVAELDAEAELDAMAAPDAVGGTVPRMGETVMDWATPPTAVPGAVSGRSTVWQTVVVVVVGVPEVGAVDERL